MAYLGQDTSETPSTEISPEALGTLNTAFQQFSNGDIFGAVSTLGPAGLQAAGLIPATVVPVFGAAIGVALALAEHLIGRGRSEADIIVPIQNQLVNSSGSGQLDQITQMLVRNPNVGGLQALYQQVLNIGQAFLKFVSDARFTDGRASEQAANTIMPYINGTCGYHWPPPMSPHQLNCLTWGDGTPGGPGTDGMLGAIARAIAQKGGQVPPPLPTQGYGTTIQTLAPAGSQNFPFIPQAGTIPANAPLSPLQATVVPTIEAGMGTTVPLLLFGGVAVLLLLRK